MFRRTGCARSFRGFPDELAESSLLTAGATRHKEVSGLQCLWAEWLALHRLVVQPKPRSEAAPARVDLRQPKVTIPEEEELSRAGSGSEKEWRWDWGEISMRAISISQVLGKDQQGGTFMNCILASDDN